jgi:hypothetical protein
MSSLKTRRLTHISALVAALALAACAASTGVIPIGSDTYSISHRDNGPLSSLGALKAAAYKDATAYCAAKDKKMQVLRSNDVPRSLGQFPETEVQFTCI